MIFFRTETVMRYWQATPPAALWSLLFRPWCLKSLSQAYREDWQWTYKRHVRFGLVNLKFPLVRLQYANREDPLSGFCFIWQATLLGPFFVPGGPSCTSLLDTDLVHPHIFTSAWTKSTVSINSSSVMLLDKNTANVAESSMTAFQNGPPKSTFSRGQHHRPQRTIIVMVAALLFGVLAAVGHHLWNSHWDDMVVETATVSQTWVRNFGTAFVW